MNDDQKHYYDSDDSGIRVRCNGTGRKWVLDYMDQTGVILGDDSSTSGVRVRLDSGEEVQFYSDEIDYI